MKIVEVIADTGHVDTVRSIAEQHGAKDFWMGAQNEDGRCAIRLLVSDEKRQVILDALQTILATSDNARIVTIPVEVSLPRPAPEENVDGKRSTTAVTREELYNSVERGARLDSTYLLLVLLSTLVAAIGLLEDNVAVVIGAMVIAPLLGPNIALALGTALGDAELMGKALRTALIGLALAALLSVVIGVLWPFGFDSRELIARTDVGLDSLTLALASGAAAVLSITTGLSSVLVGVMVAVALLPPTSTVGIMLGAGQYNLAWGATLLLLANIVCVNLAAKVVFLIRGVKPRTWLEQRKARQSLIIYVLIWIISLFVLIVAIYLRGRLFMVF